MLECFCCVCKLLPFVFTCEQRLLTRDDGSLRGLAQVAVEWRVTRV